MFSNALGCRQFSGHDFSQTVFLHISLPILANPQPLSSYMYTKIACKFSIKTETTKKHIFIHFHFLNNCKELGVYPKFFIFKMWNVSNKNPSSIRKGLLRSAINNRKKQLQHVLKELSISENFISKQLSTTDFYILRKSITSHNKKSLQKLLYTQRKKLLSLTRGCSLPIFTANETITNLTQYELFQEETDLIKAGLYFPIKADEIRKSKIFTTFKKIHHSFINLNLRKPKIR